MKRKRRSSSSNSATSPSPAAAGKRRSSRSAASCSPINGGGRRRRSLSPVANSRSPPPPPPAHKADNSHRFGGNQTYSEPTPTRTLRNGHGSKGETPPARPRSSLGDFAKEEDEERIVTPKDRKMSSSSTAAAEHSSEIRRSGRQRKLSYATFDADLVVTDEDDKKNGREVEQEDDDIPMIEDRIVNGKRREDQLHPATPQRPESPFFNHAHVRFSPSAKPGSPMTSGRRDSRHRLKRLRVRLHNVPSDDEQTEFNRRYSRDLRSRRKRALKRDDVDDNQEEEEEEGEGERDDRPVRRSTRAATVNVNNMHENSMSEFEEEEEQEEEELEEEEEIEDAGRSSRRRDDSQRRMRKSQDVALMESEERNYSDGLRRSGRTHKPIMSTTVITSSDESEVNGGKGLSTNERPKRSRAPVERLNYEANPVRSSRRCSEEIRNLDQYSSDEEFTATNEDGHRRKKRYNMRENRQTITRFEHEYPEKPSLNFRESNGLDKKKKKKHVSDSRSRRKQTGHSYKDSSSPSSSSDTDEERFKKRKNKRMCLERSKLMPVNLNKHDVTKAVFRERQQVGASLADVQPMELDLNTKFENVGGCQEHINSLMEMVVFPLIYPEVFSKFSITPPRGVLFYGPPGTGKTLMARALASECSRDGKKVAFFMRKGADCLSKWIGESERQLRLLFDQAYVMRPSIIFFDEIDGLAPVRSSRQDQIHSSIVSTLLALMDGLDNRGEIIVVGATNRIENIDPALRRPGRFDRELRFGAPTRDARRDILKLHTKSWVPPVDDQLLETLADKTIGYCGADIKGLCAESALNALRRRYPQVYKTNQKLAIEVDRIEILEEDFVKGMKSMIPSTHRVQDQNQSPLPGSVKPLLQGDLTKICQVVDHVMPAASGRDTVCYRPRLLVHGCGGQGLTTYLGPAVLHHLEKLPCYKLDIPALFSNSVRTPEEALYQIFMEARRTIPSCIYMPHVYRLFKVMNESVRETFLSLMGDILPNSPLFLLAVMEESFASESEAWEVLPSQLFSKADKEIYHVDLPNSLERKEYFAPLWKAAVEPVPEKLQSAIEEELPVLPVVECRTLTEQEEKRLQKREARLQRELRIFLRDIWAKINRESKFHMFRVGVDTTEVYDYLEVIKNPMCFDQMLTKLDNEAYKCAQDFLNDIDLIAENAITYNSDHNYETNKIICHRASALVDFCYAMVKSEMDTDFEEECKEIVARRKKLTEELSKPLATFGASTPAAAAAADGETESSRKKKPKKKVSNWAKGESSKKRLRRSKQQPDAAATDEEEEDEVTEDETVDSSTQSSTNGVDELVPTGIRIDQSRLNSIQQDLVLKTEGFNVEKLERIFARLMDRISSYKLKSDRTKLPEELKNELDSLKTAARNNHSR